MGKDCAYVCANSEKLRYLVRVRVLLERSLHAIVRIDGDWSIIVAVVPNLGCPYFWASSPLWDVADAQLRYC